MELMKSYIKKLSNLQLSNLYQKDFLLTWEKSLDDLIAIWTIADALRDLRDQNISAHIFDSGLGISLFRDNSTRTRFSFASACNLLGLIVQDLEEEKSQIAHGETVRETANMISFMADVIGIRDDLYLGKGHTYMRTVSDAVHEGYHEGILPVLPTLINLQSDIDHPTQVMSDVLHLIHESDGIANLQGKKFVMSWAYSPSYGKPLSVPQGIIALMTRLGMHVVLAHPKGYEIMPDVLTLAQTNAQESGGSFLNTNNMEEAFEGADIVYPKSWAPYHAMEQRTKLYVNHDFNGIKHLEQELLNENVSHKEWTCSEEMMQKTKDQSASYLHCLPADITGENCNNGEVDSSVFERYRSSLYRQAGYKPYIIAAMILASKYKHPEDALEELEYQASERILVPCIRRY